MSKNYSIIIQFVLPLTPFYRSGARRSDVYKRDAFVMSWRFHKRAWQPECLDRLPETSGTLWIHRGALTNQRCSLATGFGITSLSQSLYSSPPGPSPPSVLIRRPSPLLPYAPDSHLPLTPLHSAPGPPGPFHGLPHRPPLSFRLHIPRLHWSRLSLSPAEHLPSVICPSDQCRLSIYYPLPLLNIPPTLR